MALVRYLVEDVDKAAGFYASMLGFSRIEQEAATTAVLRRGDLELWLAGPEAAAAQPMPDGTVPRPGGWSRIVLGVDDLDGLVVLMRAAGVPFRNDIVDGARGRHVLCLDPSGNPVELFEAKR